MDSQLRYDPNTGEILQIFDQPSGKTDAVACNMMWIIPFVAIIKNVRTPRIEKMVKALDNIPWKERQWGHWLARNAINTKQHLVLVQKTENGVEW